MEKPFLNNLPAEIHEGVKEYEANKDDSLIEGFENMDAKQRYQRASDICVLLLGNGRANPQNIEQLQEHFELESQEAKRQGADEYAILPLFFNEDGQIIINLTYSTLPYNNENGISWNYNEFSQDQVKETLSHEDQLFIQHLRSNYERRKGTIPQDQLDNLNSRSHFPTSMKPDINSQLKYTNKNKDLPDTFYKVENRVEK